MNYAFIDSQNLNLGIKKDQFDKVSGKILYHGWDLDFGKFLIYLKDKLDVGKAFLFIGKIDGKEELYEELESYGYHMVYKPTTTYLSDSGVWKIKGNVDAELVLHSLLEINNYSTAVIVSGDSDYCCLVEYLIQVNKLKCLFVPNLYNTPNQFKRFREYIEYVSPLELKLKK